MFISSHCLLLQKPKSQFPSLKVLLLYDYEFSYYHGNNVNVVPNINQIVFIPNIGLFIKKSHYLKNDPHATLVRSLGDDSLSTTSYSLIYGNCGKKIFKSIASMVIKILY